MKFVHIADMHIDGPFVNLSDKDNLGELCRLAQRKVIKKVIEYIKQNNVDSLFIAGDLYEHTYIRETTIEYINNLFKEIPNTNIYITPGNHDPYIKNSYYNKYKWNKNVKIFKPEIKKIETEESDIYGVGFDDFYCNNSKIKDIKIDNKEKINILIAHADLDASINAEKQYNPISKKELQAKKFDYIALGHIHKPSYNDEDNQNIVYPGSTFPLGFDELGERGMIVGEIKKGKVELEFIKLNEIYFVEKEIDVTQIQSKEELIEKINNIQNNEKELIKIKLIGKRNFEIDIYDLYKLNLNKKIIKIKNETKINYNLEKIKNETTLKGLYIKEMKKRLEEETEESKKQIIEQAIEIGLEVLE